MAEHTDQVESASGQSQQPAATGSFRARLLANLALGVEIQQAYRSRLRAA